jgi:RNA polymerase sigma-70 factor (ECF subfamily)
MRALVTEAQFTELYRSLVDAVYAYASRRSGGQRQLAEDVTQETWLRAVREWRQHGVPNEPLAWLTTVARNLLLNHLRRREGVPIDAISPEEVLRAVERDDVGDSAEIATLVNGALERLPRKEARLLEAFHFERQRVSQLARAYGISERAVEGRLRRARERLRAELKLTRPKPEGGVA